MRKNPLTDRARRPGVYTNMYGVPTIGGRMRPAGTAIDDIIAGWGITGSGTGSGSSNSGSDTLPTPEELAAIAGDAGTTPNVADVPPGALTDRERARIADQNIHIIGMASQAIGETGQTIRAAIVSGSAAEVERIRQAGQLATARALSEYRRATQEGRTADANAARDRAGASAGIEQLMAMIAAQNQSKGLSTQTMVLIGLGVAAVGGGIYLATRPAASRSKNPVMVRRDKKGKLVRRFVNSKKAAHARTLGWRKAR